MEELVEKAKYGDKEAYTELIANIEKELYAVAMRRIDEPEDVEDIIQDTILIGYMNIKQIRDNKFFKAWIIKILCNECNKFYNNRKREEEINEKYVSDKEIIDYNKFEEHLEFENMIKDLSDEDKEVMKLYYEDNFTSEQISRLLGINDNTIKSKISRGKKKISATYRKVLMTILILFLVTTGVVFGKDIINYLKDIFNLSSVDQSNEGILSAIETKDWIQNTEMEYIELSEGYKIRIDYLLIDDINMYMVFDLQCEEEQNDYNRMSILDLVIRDEQGNLIYDRNNIMETSIGKFEGWKNIESNSNKQIRELNYIMSEGYPNMRRLDITFSGVTLYNDRNSEEKGKEIDSNEINISIDVDEKFINRNVIEYVQEETDMKYNITKAIITDTGFYAIVETPESNIDFELKINKKKYKCNYRCLNMNYEGEIKYYHLILANIEQEDTGMNLEMNTKTENIKLIKK